MPLLKTLSNEDQDTVRVICYQSLDKLVNLSAKDDIKTHILGMVIQGS